MASFSFAVLGIEKLDTTGFRSAVLFDDYARACRRGGFERSFDWTKASGQRQPRDYRQHRCRGPCKRW